MNDYDPRLQTHIWSYLFNQEFIFVIAFLQSILEPSPPFFPIQIELNSINRHAFNGWGEMLYRFIRAHIKGVNKYRTGIGGKTSPPHTYIDEDAAVLPRNKNE